MPIFADGGRWSAGLASRAETVAVESGPYRREQTAVRRGEVGTRREWVTRRWRIVGVRPPRVGVGESASVPKERRDAMTSVVGQNLRDLGVGEFRGQGAG